MRFSSLGVQAAFAEAAPEGSGDFMEARQGEDDWARFLRYAPPEQRRTIEKQVRIERGVRGRTLYTVTAHGSEVFFIAEGEVQVVLFSSTGKQVSINTLGPGESFGQIAAIDRGPRSASVIALTDVRLRAISARLFVAVLEESAQAAMWAAEKLCADVRRLSEKVFELSALNVQARLHCELLRLAHTAETAPLTIAPAPTHAELASRIGANREAVTREMRALAELNIIRNRRRSLEFVDLEALRRFVGRAVGGMAETPAPY